MAADRISNRVDHAQAVVQAATIGGVHIHEAAPPRVIPRQLPAPPRWLVGRDVELAALDDALRNCREDGATPVLVVDGAAGVGKTALAVRWVLRHDDEFPGGHLYANLRGFDGSGEPSTPLSVVQAFLAALGFTAQQIPAIMDEAAALYRSAIAGKRICVVLDNALDADQVVPLLPGDGSGAVVVTSRRRLSGLGLHGAWFATLGLLSESVSHALLARLVGTASLAEDQGAADDLVACCAGLPLALMVVGARAASRPRPDLPVLAAQLMDEASRFAGLDAGTAANVRSAISASYRALDTVVAWAFRHVCSLVCEDVTALAVASLLAVPADRATELLSVLDHVHLVTEYRSGRYQTHSLVRLYARELVAGDPERVPACRRLVDHYLTTAHHADHILYPHRTKAGADNVADGVVAAPIGDLGDALRWFGDERANLMAAQRTADRPDRVWLLSRALDTYLHRFGHTQDALESSRAGVLAADAMARPWQRLVAHRQLGRALTYAGDHIEAATELHGVLTIAEELNDPLQLANTHQDLARLESFAGRPESALRHATAAVTGYRVARHPVGEAHALNAQGRLYATLGRLADGHECCLTALALHRAHANTGGAIATLDNLGNLAELAGRPAEAASAYREALVLCRAGGEPTFETELLDHLAHAEQD